MSIIIIKPPAVALLTTAISFVLATGPTTPFKVLVVRVVVGVVLSVVEGVVLAVVVGVVLGVVVGVVVVVVVVIVVLGAAVVAGAAVVVGATVVGAGSSNAIAGGGISTVAEETPAPTTVAVTMAACEPNAAIRVPATATPAKVADQPRMPVNSLSPICRNAATSWGSNCRPAPFCSSLRAASIGSGFL